MLAQGEEALGQRLRAMRAQAEARAAVGDLNGAVDRLRAAQTLARTGAANDFIEASVIDARLRQLEAQRREISAELRAK
jgi:predicted Zn-dependent protease